MDWLRERRPAHGIVLLQQALEFDAPAAVEVPEPQPEPEAEPLPDNEVSDTQILLGIDLHTGETVAIDLAMLRKHIAIFAGSGSGKTVLIRRLVEECALRGVSAIVLDPNNDLSRLGSAWPELPNGWRRSDDARAQDYLQNTEVVHLDAAPLQRPPAGLPAAARFPERRR